MDTIKEAVLLRVQYNVKQELMRQLDSRHYYTGHSIVIKNISDVKNNISVYALNEMDEAQRHQQFLIAN